MDMVERVATALKDELARQDGAEPWQFETGTFVLEYVDQNHVDFGILARAAIEAMREPTDAMKAAVEKAQDDGDYVMYEHIDWDEAWPIAIDAALSAKP